ncbi:MAG: hypothetical protein HYV97_14575 [Bdellovibrio sp.]|nr:hypothetical protein [Bdellovibrio sp.]
MTVQSETAPPVGANAETDCTAITTGTGGGASGSGSGSGSGTHSSDH